MNIEKFDDKFLECVNYREFDVIVKSLLPSIKLLSNNMAIKNIVFLIKQHFAYNLQLLDKQLRASVYKVSLSSFIEILNLIKDSKDDNCETTMQVLTKFCDSFNNETIKEINELASDLHCILLIMESLDQLNQSSLYRESNSQCYNTFAKTLEYLKSEKSLEYLLEDYLPKANHEKATEAIIRIYAYGTTWMDKITTPLKEQRLVVKFLEEMAYEQFSNDTSNKIVIANTLSCIFKMLDEKSSDPGIMKFSIEFGKIIIHEIERHPGIGDNSLQSKHFAQKAYFLLKLQLLAQHSGAQNARLTHKIKKAMKEYVDNFSEMLKSCVGVELQNIFKEKSIWSNLASVVISEYDFTSAKNYIYSIRTSKDISEILKDLKIKHTNIISLRPERPWYVDNLDKHYDYFFCNYNKLYDSIILSRKEGDFLNLLGEIVGTVKKISEQYQLSEKNQHALDTFRNNPKDVNLLIAYVFAAWTYLEVIGKEKKESKNDSNIIVNSSDTIIYGRRPHAAQIVSILLLLGMDNINPQSTNNNKQGLQNRILQLGTGEGKSIAIAGAVIAFALLGYEVDVACYSQYLAKRDQLAFKDLFELWALNKNINYDDLKYTANHRVIKVYGDVRKLFDQYMQGNNPEPLDKKNDSKSILVIDEVDRFFSNDFLGRMFRPVAFLRGEAIKKLLTYIWEHQTDVLSGEIKLKNLQEFEAIFNKYPRLIPFKQKLAKKIVVNLEFAVKGLYFGYAIKDNNKIVTKDDSCGSTCTEIYNGIAGNAFIALKHKLDGDEYMCLSPCCGEFSYLDMLKYYDHMLGVSATVFGLGEFQDNILKQNGISSDNKIPIPSTFAKQAIKRETLIFCEKKEDKDNGYFAVIKKDVEEKIKDGRAILLLFNDLKRLEEYKNYIGENKGYCHECKTSELLTTTDHEERNLIIQEAATPGKVTLMLRVYGRGSDFICHNQDLVKKGGVHVICSFLPESEAEKIQIEGRTCRQDDSGSIKYILLKSDLPKIKTVDLSVNISDETIVEVIKELQEKSGKGSSSSILTAQKKQERTEWIAKRLYGFSIIKKITGDNNNIISLNSKKEPTENDVEDFINECNF